MRYPTKQTTQPPARRLTSRRARGRHRAHPCQLPEHASLPVRCAPSKCLAGTRRTHVAEHEPIPIANPVANPTIVTRWTLGGGDSDGARPR